MHMISSGEASHPWHPPSAKVHSDFESTWTLWTQVRSLFDAIPGIDFFIKDRDGRFVFGSQVLLQRVGFTDIDQLVGLTDAQIHPARIARDIRNDDLAIMETGRPLINRIEALYTKRNAKDWYITTKFPVKSEHGEIIGVMGCVRKYRDGSESMPGANRLAHVLSHIQENHHQSLCIEDLAKVACMSQRQLQRHFLRVFGISVRAFIIRTRVQAACDDLLQTDKELLEIALEHGFSDQSAFCRHFLEHTGETPLRYRRTHRGEL